MKNRKLLSCKFGNQVAQRTSQPERNQRRDHEITGSHPATMQVRGMLATELPYLADDHRNRHPYCGKTNEQQGFATFVNTCPGKHTHKEAHQGKCAPSSINDAERKNDQEHREGGHSRLAVDRPSSEDSRHHSTSCPRDPSRSEHRSNRHTVNH